MSKYGIFSGPYFPVFELNTGKYGPEKTPYLDIFHAVTVTLQFVKSLRFGVTFQFLVLLNHEELAVILRIQNVFINSQHVLQNVFVFVLI